MAFTPHPNPTLKGLLVRTARLAVALACFCVSLLTVMHFRGMTTSQRLLADAAIVGLVVVLWKRDRLLPLPD